MFPMLVYSTLSWAVADCNDGILFLFLLPRCSTNIATGQTAENICLLCAGLLDCWTQQSCRGNNSLLTLPPSPSPSPLAAHHCSLWCCKGICINGSNQGHCFVFWTNMEEQLSLHWHCTSKWNTGVNILWVLLPVYYCDLSSRCDCHTVSPLN